MWREPSKHAEQIDLDHQSIRRKNGEIWKIPMDRAEPAKTYVF